MRIDILPVVERKLKIFKYYDLNSHQVKKYQRKKLMQML